MRWMCISSSNPAFRYCLMLELVESRGTSSGVTIQVYRPTGRPQYANPTPTT